MKTKTFQKKKRKLIIWIFASLLILGGLFLGGREYLRQRTAFGADSVPKELEETDWRELLKVARNRESTEEAGINWENEMEATQDPITPDDLTEESIEGLSFVDTKDEEDPCTPGLYQVMLTDGNEEYECWLRVTDTTPPSGEGCTVDLSFGETADIEDFVQEVEDVTPVSLSYEKEPDFSMPGTHLVSVALIDTSGNKTVVDSWARIKDNRDYDMPELTGPEDQVVIIGDTIAYKKGVSAYDPTDGELEVQVDTSLVKKDEPGTYPVTYIAADAAGHQVSETVMFTFVAPAPEDGGEGQSIYSLEDFDRTIDDYYNMITSDQKSEYDRANDIYTWIRNSVWYTGSGFCEDWRIEAMYALDNRGGDCFTFYSVAKALLDRAGIENLCVTKILIPGRSDHFWLMVNVDDAWYHYDCTPRAAGGWFFLWTDEAMLEYSEAHNDCFDFDLTLYPRTPGTIDQRFLEKFYPAE